MKQHKKNEEIEKYFNEIVNNKSSRIVGLLILQHYIENETIIKKFANKITFSVFGKHLLEKNSDKFKEYILQLLEA